MSKLTFERRLNKSLVMKNIRNLILFAALISFIACQGPYHKSEKKPVKIGLKDAIAKNNSKDDADSAEPKEDIEETATLDNKGVGPVENVEIGDGIDQAMADAGKETFNTLCIACHKLEGRFVGPPLKDVTKFRSPEWIMNMILDPDKMLDEDPVAQALLDKYGAPMVNLGLSNDEAREVLEYFRSLQE